MPIKTKFFLDFGRVIYLKTDGKSSGFHEIDCFNSLF